MALFPALNIRLRVAPPIASCLWLAAELGARLLTLDDALRRAWKRGIVRYMFNLEPGHPESVLRLGGAR